jgi:hypothetical protein
MKLSSPPTRYAFTSVIAAAMKYGPTRVSRIAYELDMPVETCRYYLKRFHNMGFRFFPVVDYWALGLQPCILFVRFSKNLDPQKAGKHPPMARHCLHSLQSISGK